MSCDYLLHVRCNCVNVSVAPFFILQVYIGEEMCEPVASSVSDTELRCTVPPLLAGTYPVWFCHIT